MEQSIEQNQRDLGFAMPHGVTTKIEDILASNPSRQVLRHFLMDRAKDFTTKILVGKLSRSDRREHSRLLAKRFVKSIREEQHANVGL